MSHFYGTVQGHRGEASRCGAKSSGLETWAAGWQGAIKTHIWYDPERQQDRFRITLEPWQGSGGDTTHLASGTLQSEWDPEMTIMQAVHGIQLILKCLDRYNSPHP